MNENACTQDQIDVLEDIYNELYLDGLQDRIRSAIGPYWADDIQSEIAALDFEIRDTLAQMQEVIS